MIKSDKPHWEAPEFFGRFYAMCSECGAIYDSKICEVARSIENFVFYFEMPRFCPHCGVEMKGEDDER